MAERWYGGWDSGINSEAASAAATKPPSCSGHEVLRPPGCPSVNYGLQQNYYSQQQIIASASSQEMEFSQNTPLPHHFPQVQAQVIESKTEMSFGGMYHQPQPQVQQQIKEAPFTPSASASFAGPQRITNEVSEDDTALKAIPKIIELLCDEDPFVVSHACKLVQEMSKSSERSKQAVIQSQPMIEAIVSTLTTSRETEIVRVLTGTLHTLSQVKQGLMAICQYGGIPALVFVLSAANCPVDHTTTNYALTMLHNALLQEKEIKNVKQQANSCQGAAVLTRLLSNNNPKFLAILIDCLHVLCYQHNESKLAVVNNGGPQHLVRILRSHSYEKLLWTVTRLIKILSTCQQNKEAIIEAGGMHALTAHLSQPSSRLVMNCLWSLRNLSDAATKQTGLDHLMHFLLKVLQTVQDRDMVSCAIGVLSNLTCNNQHNKIVICNQQGIETICHMLVNFGMDQHNEILSASISALRHLTSKHPGSEQAQAVFRNMGGVQFLARLLSTPWNAIKPPIVKATCGLLRNLALVEANHPVLLESGCLYRLADILVPAAHELLGAAEAGMTSPPKSQDGTRLDDLAEQAAAALHSLLKDPACRQAAKQTGIPQALVQLSSCGLVSEAARKQAHGAFQELAAPNPPPSAPQPPPQNNPQAQERLQPPPQQQQQQSNVPQQPQPQQQQPVQPPQQYHNAPSQVPPSKPLQTVQQQPMPPASMTPMLYQQQTGSISQPQTPKQQRPPQPQPSAHYQQQLQQQQYPPVQQEPHQAHSLPQSPYHPPRMMSTQPATMSVPPTPHQSHQQQQQPPVRSHSHQQAMTSEIQQQQQMMPAHHQQQYSHQQHMQAMQQQQQQQWYQQDPQHHQMVAPPQAHQMQYHQQYANQYAASPQHYGY